MATVEENSPTFSGFVKATGQATIWNKNPNMTTQYYRPSNVASWAERKTYSKGTLLYNWNEDMFDVSYMARAVVQPSRYDHYYTSTYRQCYSRRSLPASGVLECLKYTAGQ